MENGAHLRQLKREIASLRKQGEHGDAALLQKIACGGLWPRTRMVDACVIVDTNLCVLFREHPDTMAHRAWGCKILNAS